jgi:hypothetical protein
MNGPVYSQFIDDPLGRALGLNVTRVDGNFGGQAWLVTDKAQNRVILVEHETGLEILGALASVATLVQLLPLISSGWTNLRQRYVRPHFGHPDEEGIEVRRFDHNDVLIEQQSPSVEIYVLSAALQDYALLRQEVDQLKAQIESLQKQLSASNKGGTVRPRSKKKKNK